jgi:hypothetical protein
MSDRDDGLSTTWVDEFINSVQDIVTNKNGKMLLNISGQNVEVAIEAGLLGFLIDNRDQLFQVGIEAFKQFLDLLSQKQSFQALMVVYSKFDNQSLVDAYRQDSVKLAEIAAQTQATRDFWIQFAMQAGEKAVSSALGALLP